MIRARRDLNMAPMLSVESEWRDSNCPSISSETSYPGHEVSIYDTDEPHSTSI